MVGITFTLQGMDALITKLRGIPEGISTFVQEDVMNVGHEAVSAMQGQAPVLTGFLRDNIGVTNSSNIAVQVASLAYYSIYVELGTSKMEPEPFFFDNAYAAGDKLFTDLQTYIQNLVR